MPTTTARNKGFLSHMLYLGEIGKLRMKYNNEEYPPPQNEEDIDNKSDEGKRFELIDTTISDASLDIAEMLVSKTKYEDKRMLENDDIQHFDYQKRQIEKDLLIRSFITTLLKKTNQFTHLKNDEISIDYAERLIKEAGSKKQSFGDLSILFVVHEKADILGIRARINEYFLRKLGCDTQEYYSDRYDFQKDARNITIIYPKICLMYLRNTRFSLSDIDFLIFYPSRSKLGENNQFEVIINEFYMPEVVAGSKKMPKLMIYEPQLEKGKGGREGIKFVFDLMNMNTRWELSIQAKFWSELFTHALHILEVQIDQFQKEKSQKAKNNSLIKKYGEQLKIFKPAMLAPFPDYNGVCYRQFWTAFVGIKDICEVQTSPVADYGSIRQGISETLASVLLDPHILEQVYGIDTEINALNHKPIESGIAPDSYKLPKKELWQQILASSQYLIDQTTPPVFQFMFLFNKSISIYGSQVYEALGLNGLLDYTTKVIERLYSVYEERVNQGYRSNLRYYDGRQDQYDFYQLGLLQRLRDLYISIVMRFRESSIQRKIPMHSDKVRLICEELKNDIEKDDIKTLILTESSTVGIILGKILNEELKSKMKKKQISAKFYYISRLNDSACHSQFESDPKIPFEYEGFFKPEQMSLGIDHNFRRDGTTFDLCLYECCLKDICNETLLTNQKDGFPQNPLQEGEKTLLISNSIYSGFIHTDTKILILDPAKFSNIVFMPQILKTNVDVSFVHDQKSDLKRKISRLDRIMKKTYYGTTYSESQISSKEEVKEKKEQAIKNSAEKIWVYKKENNRYVSVQWTEIGKVFENMILNYLTQNYEKADFDIKHISSPSDHTHRMKATVSLDGELISVERDVQKNMVLRDLIPNLIHELNVYKINGKNKILNNLSVIPTSYFVHQTSNMADTKINKDKTNNNDQVKDFGGLVLPQITYEFLMNVQHRQYHDGEYLIYHQIKDPKGVLHESKDKAEINHGILYTTDIWLDKKYTKKESTDEVETGENNTEVWSIAAMNDFSPEAKSTMYKTVMVKKTSQKRLVNLYHLEFYSLFMYFKALDAVGLFYFYFLTDAILCAKMLVFENELIFERKQLEEEIKKWKEEIKTLEEENPEAKDICKEIDDDIQANEELLIDIEIITKFKSFYNKLREKLNGDKISNVLNDFICLSATEFIDVNGAKPLIVPQKEGFINRDVIQKFYNLFISKIEACWDNPYELLKLTLIHERDPLGGFEQSLYQGYHYTFPLYVKFCEKCYYIDFVTIFLKNICEVKQVQHEVEKRQSNRRKCYKAVTYELDIDHEKLKPPVYFRKREKYQDRAFNFDPSIGEALKAMHFEHLIDNIEESLTPEKIDKYINNNYLEFLGDGVISVLLAWDLIMKQMYKNNNNQNDIDTERIQNSSSRKLIELCKDAEIYNKNFANDQKEEDYDDLFNFPLNYCYLHDYIVRPGYKLFNFFCAPLLSFRYGSQLYTFENVENAKEIISGLENKAEAYRKEHKEAQEDKEKEDFIDCVSKMNYKEDYKELIEELYKEINEKDDLKLPTPEKKRKILERNSKNLYKLIKHNELATCFKAFIGALYNCCGLQTASKFLNVVGLTKYISRVFKNEWDKEEIFNDKERFQEIKEEFSEITIEEDQKTVDSWTNKIEELTGYKFVNEKILVVALTHKTQSFKTKSALNNDYNTMEFLGDSILKFFNCKRIIRKRDDYLKMKEVNFTPIQRLKFIKTHAEKNALFAFMCVDSGIHTMIRHKTENQDKIDGFEQILKEKGKDITIEDTDPYFIKMLADIIESIIGAIFIDSGSISRTEKAWEIFFEDYLRRYADNPPPPPKRAFAKYCDKYDYLRDFKDASLITTNLSREQLKQTYPDYDGNTVVIMYRLIYKDKPVFIRYYDNSVKNKDRKFYTELKEIFHQNLVPICNKTLVPILEDKELLFSESKKSFGRRNNQYKNLNDMSDHDLNGRKYTNRLKSVLKSKNKFIFEEIKAKSGDESEEEVIDTSSKKNTSSISNTERKAIMIHHFDQWFFEYYISYFSSTFSQILINPRLHSGIDSSDPCLSSNMNDKVA